MKDIFLGNSNIDWSISFRIYLDFVYSVGTPEPPSALPPPPPPPPEEDLARPPLPPSPPEVKPVPPPPLPASKPESQVQDMELSDEEETEALQIETSGPTENSSNGGEPKEAGDASLTDALSSFYSDLATMGESSHGATPTPPQVASPGPQQFIRENSPALSEERSNSPLSYGESADGRKNRKVCKLQIQKKLECVTISHKKKKILFSAMLFSGRICKALYSLKIYFIYVNISFS